MAVSNLKNATKLQRFLIAYTTLGVFTISVIVALASTIPLHHKLRQSQEQDLQFALHNRTLTVQEFLSRAKGVAEQIASRTKARQILESYNQNQISSGEVLRISTNILTEAMNRTTDVIGITRLDQNHQLVARVGLTIPPQTWLIPPQDSTISIIDGPIVIDQVPYLIVGTPILDPQQERIGTDLVLFKTTALQQIVADHTGLGNSTETILGRIHGGRAEVLFPRLNSEQDYGDFLYAALEEASGGNQGIRVSQANLAEVVAFEALPELNWGIIVKRDSRELCASVNRDLLGVGIAIVILSTLATGGFILLFRPLTQQIIHIETELEQEVGKKLLPSRN
jgi:hypothetical protein